MREKKNIDRELFDAQYENFVWSVNPKNPLVEELAAIDRLLDEVPEILDLVHGDLAHNVTTGPGRPGEATCEQILRAVILKQLRSLSYRQLAEEIDASPLYRKFTRFYGKKIPHFNTLDTLIKGISDETMRQVNEAVVRLAIEKKIEDGKSVRHDTTVAQTDIARPCDSRLLNDCVRVLSRHLERLREVAPELSFAYHNHTRAAKKRAYQIAVGKGKDIERKRTELYVQLLDLQLRVRGYAQSALEVVYGDDAVATRIEVMGVVVELENVLTLAEQVYNQAHRRVILGEQVPACEKIVSIFEPHTDIICRGKKGSPTEFGHKFDVATGRSGLVTRYEVYQGNPCDGEVLKRALDDHASLFGQAPERLAGDRRYHSESNEAIACAAGVREVALPKPGRLSEVRRSLQKAPWFRRLMRFRAGVEGNLSTLLRSFGLKRCLWKGWASFKAYIGLGVLTYNLRLLAGHATRA
jgi:transposase, IS5 family